MVLSEFYISCKGMINEIVRGQKILGLITLFYNFPKILGVESPSIIEQVYLHVVRLGGHLLVEISNNKVISHMNSCYKIITYEWF